ncbi:hypothetical protein DPMN_005142 [Dreissena polymorpha]|uniref:Uncharacterized protein n=1 Tax=Dreissena polymorpha TaxID=45954 RepID=A0A9D4RU53_DREPO|nr:hypothetical protein DPMN_005142 [Dreissena polymorpha]
MADAKNKLKIDRAHRIGRFQFNKHRPVVVKFNYFQDKIDVKQRIRDKQQTTPIRVADQFPKEIQDRRRKLIPFMIKCRNEGKNVNLNYDKLYVDNRMYTADNVPDVERSIGGPTTTASATRP